jgi:lipid-A-disaccharide synthase
LHKILSGKSRETIQNEYEILEQKLGGKGASEKTANGIISSIKI